MKSFTVKIEDVYILEEILRRCCLLLVQGELSEGKLIAVKQLSAKSRQGNREFVNEIGMISALQHPNLVKLYGCCVEGNQLILVYEYLENNCLSRALFGIFFSFEFATVKYMNHISSGITAQNLCG